MIDKDEASPLPSPCFTGANSNGDRDDDRMDRIPTGIPGALKSPLPGIYPSYGSINQNLLAARASLLSRNLAAGLAQLPGKYVMVRHYFVP